MSAQQEPSGPQRPEPLGGLPEEVRPVGPADDVKADADPVELDPASARKGPELEGKRTAFTSTYVTDQPGVYVTEVGSSPIHHQDVESGRWVDSDSGLVPDGRGGWVAAASGTGVAVAATADDPRLATLSSIDGSARVSFGIEGAGPAPGRTLESDQSTVVFADAIGGVDVELTSTALGIKEQLVLESAADAAEFRFPLEVSAGFDVVLTPEGTVDIVAEGSPEGTQPVLRIPRGWMSDSSRDPETGEPAISDGVRYSLDRGVAGTQTVLVVSIDHEWLSAPQRVFPVRVDPTISSFIPSADDTFVNSIFPTTDFSSSLWLSVGANGTWSANHSYFHLPDFSTTYAGMTIHDATLNVWQTSGQRCDVIRDLYQVTSPWTGSTATWSSQPSLGALISTATTSFAGSGSGCEGPGTVTFDVTSAARNWADGTWDNDGVALKARTATFTSPSQYGVVGSADNGIYTPYLLVYWSDPSISGVPFAPSSIEPTGGVDTVTPTLSAVYDDPDYDQGHVLFFVHDVDTNQVVAGGLGSLVASGGTSTWTVPSAALDWEKAYRVEAISIDDPLGTNNPFDPTLNGSAHVEVEITPTTGPFEPSGLAPAGRIADDTPTLSATYEDRDNESGFVRFEIYDATPALVVTVDSSVVSSGQTATATVPPGQLTFGTNYTIRSISIDNSNIGSVNATAGSFSPSEPRPAVIDEDVADPEVVRDGGTYYAFSTNNAGNVPMRSSTDLVTWTSPTDALPDVDQGWAIAGKTWAPTVTYLDGTWVLYYTADHETNIDMRCIGIATSDDIGNDPFVVADDDPLVCETGTSGDEANGGAIDAEVFIEEDGTPYLLWKNDGNNPAHGNGDVSLWARELAPDGLSFATSSAPVEMLSYEPGTWEQGSLGIGSRDLIEQPEMTLRNGIYYLFYSGNDYATKNYAEGYAVCPDGPRDECDKVTDGPDDPWFAGSSSDHGDASITTPTGHGVGAGTFFEDAGGVGGPGTTWMAYHAWPKSTGEGTSGFDYRALHIENVQFQTDPSIDFFQPYGWVGMKDIGDLGFGFAYANSINENNDITGHVYPGPGLPYHAFVWTAEDGFDDIGGYTFDGSQGEGINDARQVAGSTFTNLNDPTAHQASRWNQPENSFQYLPPLLAGQPSSAYDINTDGWAVGMSYDAAGDFRPTRWSPWGSANRLFGDNQIEPGSYLAEAYAINDSGQIAGYYCLYVGCALKSFVFNPYSGVDILPDLGGGGTVATDLNNGGDVVGWSETSIGETHAFSWDGTTMTDLFAGAPVGNSYALGVNDHGQVVGMYYTGPGNTGVQRGFLYDPALTSPLWDIGDLHTTSSSSTMATDINNRGIIVGSSVTSTGARHVFGVAAGDRSGGS